MIEPLEPRRLLSGLPHGDPGPLSAAMALRDGDTLSWRVPAGQYEVLYRGKGKVRVQVGADHIAGAGRMIHLRKGETFSFVANAGEWVRVSVKGKATIDGLKLLP